jgi:nucleoside-diphosphate-sugar epimerase
MKCLVTGATGYIGSSLIQRLTNKNNKVIGLLHKTNPSIINKNVKYVYGDIINKSSLENIMNDIDVVFHCAALVRSFGTKNDFNKINYEGTKNLVDVCKNNNIKMFIYLGHIQYESDIKFDYYSLSKIKTEQYLIHKYKKDKFPVVIIRPGHVYGPGATYWVIGIIKAIKYNRIALINQGNGIFHHMYIDNLIDALISLINETKAIGKQIDITDGDNSINWKTYINDLAKMLNEKPVNKNISKKSALILSNIMAFFYYMFRIEPLITPTIVSMLTNQERISIYKAKSILNYQPKINYSEAMINIEKWIIKNSISF